MRLKIILFFFIFSFFNNFCDEEKLEKYIKRNSDYVGYIEIKRERPIDQHTYLHMKFAFDYFKKKNVSFIILHLNTPGGEVFAASRISKLLKEIDVRDRIPVIAFIDDWAISAGAMLAYSSRFIATTNSSTMGAAEPVLMSGDSMQSASEKVNSALRAEFSNLASFYGRNPDIAEAMVDKDIILVKRGKKIIRLKSDDEIKKSDSVITTKGKLLTLNAQDLNNLGLSDFSVTLESLPPITKDELKKGSWSATKSLIFTYPFFKKFSDMEIISYQDWKISFFAFLTHPAVVSILFFAMIVGFYIEISTPGFGIFGSLALAALALILLGSFAAYTINWLELIILLIGALLILLEIFVIPGFGITGILGIILMIIGLVVLTIPNFSDAIFTFNIKNLNLDILAILNRIAWIGLSVLFALIIVGILTRFLMPKFFGFTPLVHKGEQEGYIAGYSKKDLPKQGEKGKAFTMLRPGGKVVMKEKIYDAIAERGFINKGEKVIISRIEGDKILVRRIKK